MKEIEEILFSAEAISSRVGELAGRISRDYAGRDIVLVCILKGAVTFTADLMRLITRPVILDFIQAASYGNSTVSSNSIEIRKDLDVDIGGRDVLLVDTIMDTGETLDRLIGLLSKRSPRSIQAAALLDKSTRRRAPVPIAYRGFVIPDRFVVGYGMDYAQKYRNLPFIAVLRE